MFDVIEFFYFKFEFFFKIFDKFFDNDIIYIIKVDIFDWGKYIFYV